MSNTKIIEKSRGWTERGILTRIIFEHEGRKLELAKLGCHRVEVYEYDSAGLAIFNGEVA